MSDDDYIAPMIYRAPAGETEPVRFLKYKDNPKNALQILADRAAKNPKLAEDYKRERAAYKRELAKNAQKDTTKLATQEKQPNVAWHNFCGTEREIKAKD